MPAMQDAGGAGLHGASMVLSSASAGPSGSLQDWFIISSSGVAAAQEHFHLHNPHPKVMPQGQVKDAVPHS